MPTDSASTAKIDYLQRCGTGPSVAAGVRTSGSSASRRLLRVRGIGRPEKDHRPSIATSDRWRPATGQLITGVYGYRIPLAYYVCASRDRVKVQVGPWSARWATADVQDRRIACVESVL